MVWRTAHEKRDFGILFVVKFEARLPASCEGLIKGKTDEESSVTDDGK
jgi:hypothetical protein